MAQTILMYGQTGSTKTSNVGEFVDFLATRHNGVTRGLFGDNYAPLKDHIRDGWLEAWDLTAEADPLGCILLASSGWWPEKLEDGRPISTSMVNGKPAPPRLLQNNFNGVAGYVIEGLMENATLFMRMLERKRQATGEPLMGEHTSTQYGQTLQYAVSSRGTYGFAQNQTHRYFKLGFKGLPVPWVMATSHEYSKKSEGIYGVAVVGKALAKVCPQWFDYCLHMVPVAGASVVKGLLEGAAAWFVPHSIDNIKWHAKLGTTVAALPEIYRQWPNGYIPLVMDMQQGRLVSSVRSLLEMIDPAPAVVVDANAAVDVTEQAA